MPASAVRLGYLLKHAQQQFGQLTTSKLEPLGITPREWAALSALEDHPGLSQREMASMLGVDRTTMVALIDDLQSKALVQRGRQLDDRRKNSLSLTKKGRGLKERGERIIEECEHMFLARLSAAETRQLREALAAVIAP